MERIDRRTIFLNLTLLGVTVFIPFATSTLGAYPSMSSSTFLYGLTLTSSAIAYNLPLEHVVRRGAFHAGVCKTTIRQTRIAYRTGLATYVIAMLASLVEPVLSFALYLLVVAYFLAPRGVDADLASK